MVEQVTPFAFTAALTALTKASEYNGWIKKMLVNVPNFTNAPTAVITIISPAGFTVFTSQECPSNATTTIGDSITAADLGEIPIGEHPWTIVCTLSGVPGSVGTVQVASYYKL
jgi:hypothetical protein